MEERLLLILLVSITSIAALRDFEDEYNEIPNLDIQKTLRLKRRFEYLPPDRPKTDRPFIPTRPTVVPNGNEIYVSRKPTPTPKRPFTGGSTTTTRPYTGGSTTKKPFRGDFYLPPQEPEVTFKPMPQPTRPPMPPPREYMEISTRFYNWTTVTYKSTSTTPRTTTLYHYDRPNVSFEEGGK